MTVLGKDNAFLRYDLQDVLRVNDKPCPCGETHKRLFYEGRVKDIVPVGGREILPIDVLLALLDCAPLKGTAIEYQIARRPNLTALPLRVEHPAAETTEQDHRRGRDRRHRARPPRRARRRAAAGAERIAAVCVQGGAGGGRGIEKREPVSR